MKKFICLLLPLVIIFGVCACSDFRTNKNFMNNDALAKAYNKILFIDSELEVLEKHYDIASPDLKRSLNDILEMQAYTDKTCAQAEYAQIMEVFDNLCENARNLKENMALVDEGKATLDTELVSVAVQNCEEFEKLFVGKK